MNFIDIIGYVLRDYNILHSVMLKSWILSIVFLVDFLINCLISVYFLILYDNISVKVYSFLKCQRNSLWTKYSLNRYVYLICMPYII